MKNTLTSFGVQQAAAKHFGGGFFTLTSGAYSFYPGLSTDAGAGTIASIGGNVVNDTDADFSIANKQGIARVAANQTAQAIIWLAVLNATNTGTNQAFLTAYYLQTSPPYDLGDGEIPLFIFALVDKDGQVKMTFVSQDPPWATPPRKKLNLDTATADAVKDPTLLQRHLEALDAHGENWHALKRLKREFHGSLGGDRVAMARDIATVEQLAMTQVEQTQDEKNRNMNTNPHPFVSNDLVGGGSFDTSAPLTPVLLNPMSKNAYRLAVLHEAGENVNSMVHDGLITVDNVDVEDCCKNLNVMICDHKFKNTR